MTAQDGRAAYVPPLDLICGCETTCQQDDGSYQVIRALRGSKCHAVGDVISEKVAWLARYSNAEWDRAERDWLEQNV